MAITGTNGPDNLQGTNGDDLLQGFAGDDLLNGLAGNDTLQGGSGNDSLSGGAGSDILDGGEGTYDWAFYDGADGSISVNLLAGTIQQGMEQDSVSGIENVGGTEWNDFMLGNEADNMLQGRGGDDWLDGGAGFDTADYYHAGAGVTVDLIAGTATGGDGNDTLWNFEAVNGSAYADVLRGTNGTNYFSGNGGDDLIDGRGGQDWVFYDSAVGPIQVTLGDGKAVGGGGNDTLVSIENVGGTGFDDFLAGDAADNVLQGRGGNDFLDGGAGFDTADYYHATGSVNVNLATHSASGADGDDQLYGFEGVGGSWFSDVLVGDAGSNAFIGLGGDDFIDGGAGFDHVGYWDATGGVDVNLNDGLALGGSGVDTLISIESVSGSAHDDMLVGNLFDNSLHGEDGNDVLVGEGGDDYLVGGRGDDRIDGGANGTFGDNVSYFSSTAGVTVNLGTQSANDGMGGTDVILNVEHVEGSLYGDHLTGDGQTNWFRPHSGDDYVNGAGGQDVVMYESSENAVNVDLRAGNATGAWIGSDTLVSIEAVHASRFNDTVQLADVAGNPANPQQGGYVFGRAGDDLLQGGALNDNLIGGRGNDTLVGGAGADSASYFDDGFDGFSGSGVTVNLGTGQATDNWGNTDTLSGIEGVSGSEYGDHITGSAAGGEFFNGNGGNDFIDGAGGNDFIQGGNGNDTLRGGAGSDTLTGGAGNDDIDGGAITDLINYTDLNTADYSSSGAGIVMDLDTGVVQDGMGGTDSVANVNWVVGSAHNDSITGSSGIYFEQFDGGLGNDRIDGGAIDAFTMGNSNRVSYANSNAAVQVDLAEGSATGGMGNDTLVNINHVFGSRFADTLVGSDSTITESFNGRGGNDFIDGAGGIDEVRYTNAGRSVNVNLATGTATDGELVGGVIGNDILRNIEGVRGGNFADTLVGGNVANDTFEFFMGMSGNDFIDGGSGYDRVDYNSSTEGVNVTLGGTGEGSASDGLRVNGTFGADRLFNIEAVRGSNFNDVLTGSDTGALESFEGRGGNDTIDGKAGVDRADYQSSMDAVVVNLATGTAADGWGGTDSLANIENVRGSNFNDTITGNDGANVFHGGAGADVMNGAGGNDLLVGGAGNDTLTGGAGADQFMFDASGNGIDRIADFMTDDQVLVLGTVSGRATAGNGSSLAAGAMQASTANGVTTLYIGTDAVAGADVQIQFQGTYDPAHFLATGSSGGYTAIQLDVPQGGSARVAELAVQNRATSVAHADVAANVAGRSTTNEVAVARLLEALARVNGSHDVGGGSIGGGEDVDMAAGWSGLQHDTPLL